MRRAFALALIVLAACSDDTDTLGNGRRTGTSGGTSGTSGTSGTTGDGTSGNGGTSGTPSTSGTSGNGMTTTGTTAADVCFDTINMYRATKGLPAYTHWTAEERCADGQAKSDGSSKSAHGAFGTCMENAQNECPGWPGPPETMIPMCLAAMWAEGPGGGHYDSMTSQQYTTVSCGFGNAPDGSIWAVQNFR